MLLAVLLPQIFKQILMISGVDRYCILVLRAASKTGVRNIPILGQVVATGAAA